MEIRYLENCEKNRIRELYDKIFNDPEPFTDYYFSNICKNDVLVLEEYGNILSMLQLVSKQVVLNGELTKVHYIYAVATDERYRFRGYMDKLINKAMADLEKSGEPFVYLTPVEPNLYKKYGFEIVYDKHIYGVKNIKEEDKIFEPTQLDMRIMKILCDNILTKKYKLYINHDEAYIKDIINQMMLNGGYLTYQKENDEIVGYSIVGSNGEVWESIFDIKPINLVYKRTMPWIMVKKFDENIDITKVYINDET